MERRLTPIETGLPDIKAIIQRSNARREAERIAMAPVKAAQANAKKERLREKIDAEPKHDRERQLTVAVALRAIAARGRMRLEYFDEANNLMADAIAAGFGEFQFRRRIATKPVVGQAALILTGRLLPTLEAECLAVAAAIEAQAGNALDDQWRGTRWIRANSAVTSDDIRTARHREKQIRSRPRGKQLEYYIPDIEREFPGKAKDLSSKTHL